MISPTEQVNVEVPSCFICHTVEDAVVPVENAFLFAVALRQKNVPFEIHIYPWFIWSFIVHRRKKAS
ncbi:prolyl oligopeptidase family serine peptidase [Enterococcus faecium]|nr:prolyl oligopeptidase family serine peptidase [Enterococcus faecium]